MEREVKFSLVFRDMWQSAGKYQPRVDQLLKVAPAIIKMGCFDRVETNGNMNHLYFLFSHKAAEELYEGYYRSRRIYLSECA